MATSLSGWEVESAYENPGNLAPERVTILKEFWATLLVLFSTKDSLSKVWEEHFPPTADYSETAQFSKILDELTGESFRSEFYRLLRHDYADMLPMRFLKARSYEIDRAMRMLLTALHYRRDKIARAMRSEAEGDVDFISALRNGKSYVPCYDNQGRTITYIPIAKHSRGDGSQDTFERFTLYAMEHAHLLHLPYQDRTVLLVDMSNFSITSLDLSSIKFIIQNFEQYYPEELSEGIIHNAPWLFGTAWAIIKPLLRGPTREKITFTSSISQLAAKIGQVEAEKVLSTKMEYIAKPESEPVFKDEAQDLKTASRECVAALQEWNRNVDQFEEITKEWARPVASDTPVAEISDLSDKRAELAWKLSRSYWSIDEFVRPRSHYDRAGQLPPSSSTSLNVAPVAVPRASSRTSGKISLKSQLSSMSLSKSSTKNGK